MGSRRTSENSWSGPHGSICRTQWHTYHRQGSSEQNMQSFCKRREKNRSKFRSIKKHMEQEAFDWGSDKNNYPAMIGSDSKSIVSTFLGNPPVCDDCGKEFSSWKALFDHAMCHSDKGVLDSLGNTEIVEHPNRISHRSMKGKRSKRTRLVVGAHPLSNFEHQTPTTSFSEHEEEKELAESLVMLSTANGFSRTIHVEEGRPDTSGSTDTILPATGVNASERDQLRPDSYDNSQAHRFKVYSNKTGYECNTCKKIFHSFQALGGHRASHKKVKGCSAKIDAVPEENESLGEELISREDLSRPEQQLSDDFYKLPPPSAQLRDISDKEEKHETLRESKEPEVHKCSICHRSFASGQALGGHKRCHWMSGGANSDTTSTIYSPKQPSLEHFPPRSEWLDLNLPAPVDEDDYGTHMDHDPSPPKYHLVNNTTDLCRHIIPRHVQPRWIGGNSKHVSFLYNYNRTHLAPDDEADSKLRNKSGFVM